MEDNTYYAQMPVKLLRHLSNKTEFQEYFKRTSLSVIDVGCNLPINLFPLYHDFNFTTLIGIDTQSQSYIIRDWFSRHPIDKNPTIKYGSTFYEFYCNNIDPLQSDNTNRQNYLSEIEFPSVIQFISNMSGNYYFNSLNENIKFDYVILENILHLLTYDEQIDLMQNINEHISINGLIYIYVHHKENQVLDQNPLTEEKLNDLLQNRYMLIEKKIFWDDHKLNKKAILYLGKFLE